jgi:hypothetical protein
MAFGAQVVAQALAQQVVVFDQQQRMAGIVARPSGLHGIRQRGSNRCRCCP